jgi:type II secretory pathway pseudopilin PulG
MSSRSTRPARREGGFTLVELFVVMIIVLMLMFMAVMMFNEMFRGQEARTAGRIVEHAIADARTWAATTGKPHLVVFSNTKTADRGTVEVFQDVDRSGSYSAGTDKATAGGRQELPKFCFFGDASNGAGAKAYPDYIVVYPTGFARLAPVGYGVQRSAFDANFNQTNPSLMGDVVIVVKNKAHRMCLDIDPSAGKVRRQEYLHITN